VPIFYEWRAAFANTEVEDPRAATLTALARPRLPQQVRALGTPVWSFRRAGAPSATAFWAQVLN